MSLTLGDVLERVIADGLDAVERDYARPDQRHQREGSISGFHACRGREPDQLAVLLEEARRDALAAYRAKAADYWFWRCREAEVEWVCNVVSAVLLNEGLPTLVAPTCRGVMKAAEIVGVAA